jgi:hypothetical protein
MKNSNLFAVQRRRRRRGPTREEGATMVEFAIVCPFALLLVLGIIQLGLMLTAKEVVNEAAFLAARAGAVQNADKKAMTDLLTKALIPFYQDTTDPNGPLSRVTAALGKSYGDTVCVPFVRCFLTVDILNPTTAAFQDFGLAPGSASENHTYIPNDNLEFRSHSITGPSSGLSIQDANVLKIKVTYGYEIKVPLMQSVIKSVMCGFDTGVDAFGRGNLTVPAGGNDCTNFYNQGRIPIVAYATVQMQTPAWEPQ